MSVIAGCVAWGGMFVMNGCGNRSYTDDCFTWQIDPATAQPMDLSRMVDSICLVPLETKDECLIKRIRSIEYAAGKYYLNNDFLDVQVYDSLGRFLYDTRGSLGNGPKDYQSVIGCTPLSSDTLELFDAVARKLRYYVYPEGVVKSCPLPSEVLPASEYTWINGDTCLFAEGTTDNTFLKFYSKSRNAFFKTVGSRQKGSFMHVSDALLRVDGTLYHSPVYPSNDLYVLDGNLDRVQVLRLDFGKYNFSIDDIPEGMTMRQSADYYSEHKDWAYPYVKYILDDWYVAFFQFEEKFCVACLNRHTGENLVLQNEIGGKPQLMKPDYVRGNQLYYASAPEYLPYVVDTSLMNAEEAAKMEGVKEDDNPVLVIYKMKAE